MPHQTFIAQPVLDDHLIEYENSLGGPIPIGPPTISLFIPDREYILTNPRLDVWRPTGKEFTDTTISRRIADELGETLGGWFANDLIPFIRLYHDFYSDPVYAYLAMVSARPYWGKGQGPFYFAAFRIDEYQVQAFGRPGDFHAMFLARDLANATSIDTLSREEQRRNLDAVLRRVAPKIDPGALRLQKPNTEFDPTEPPSASEALREDLYLAGSGLSVRAGVRRRVPAAMLPSSNVLDREHLYGRGAVSAGDSSLFYGIRINIDMARIR